jgi:hypothetical protein
LKLHLFLQKLIAELFHDEEELLNVVDAHQVASIRRDGFLLFTGLVSTFFSAYHVNVDHLTAEEFHPSRVFLTRDEQLHIWVDKIVVLTCALWFEKPDDCIDDSRLEDLVLVYPVEVGDQFGQNQRLH